MATYNTGNPLGSVAVKDLFDNAQNLDSAVNSRASGTWTDRFGVERKTWKGIEDKAAFDIATAVAKAVEEGTVAAEGFRDESAQARDESRVARDAAQEARADAVAAAGAIGPVEFYDTYAQALAAAAGEKRLIEIARDETLGGARTRYWAEGGTLDFAVNLDQWRLDLTQPSGNEPIGGFDGFGKLKAYSGKATVANVIGPRISARPTIEGVFHRFDGDASTPDDGGVYCIRDALNRAWLRKIGDTIYADWGGARPGVESQDAINRAATVASRLKIKLSFFGGEYLIRPSISTSDEAGLTTIGIELLSNLWVITNDDTTLKIVDGFSTDAAPKRHALFFSKKFLKNIKVIGPVLDMNGYNNPISPNRLDKVFSRFTNAQIIFSGTINGVAAGANNVVVKRTTCKNNAGVSCIVMAQSNTSGITLGKGWKLLHNRFENVGLDTDDHSSVFGWATNVDVLYNTFTNDVPRDIVKRVGGLVAYEIHGSNTTFSGNHINNYYQGLWVGSNLSEDVVRNILVFGNTARVSGNFLDFFSANLTSGESAASKISVVNAYGNVIEITSDAVGDQVKAFFKIAARKQPTQVKIHNNICRTTDTTKNVVLCLAIASPNQLAMADQIEIYENECTGVVAGVVFYFNGNGSDDENDFGSFSVENNRLGTLAPSPGGLYLNVDIILYGPSAGRVRKLRVGGLEQANPINVGANYAGSRATVYGKAVVPVTVNWNGITIGNGATFKKIAIDTDAGVAMVHARVEAGTTTTAAGPIYPIFSGLLANANSTATVMHSKTGSILSIAALVQNTANYVSLYTPARSQFSAVDFSNTSALTLEANFPCAYANI